jgi:hypothetical protein
MSKQSKRDTNEDEGPTSIASQRTDSLVGICFRQLTGAKLRSTSRLSRAVSTPCCAESNRVHRTLLRATCGNKIDDDRAGSLSCVVEEAVD